MNKYKAILLCVFTLFTSYQVNSESIERFNFDAIYTEAVQLKEAINRLGREHISKNYFQRIKENNILLTQINAKDLLKNEKLNKLRQLQLYLDKVLTTVKIDKSMKTVNKTKLNIENNNCSTAQKIYLDRFIAKPSQNIYTKSEWFEIDFKNSHPISISTTGSYYDFQLSIHENKCGQKPLYFNDDTNGLDAEIIFKPKEGTKYFIQLKRANDQSFRSYNLNVTNSSVLPREEKGLIIKNGTSNGIIRGVLTDELSGNIVTSYRVNLINELGSIIGLKYTDNTGRFIFNDLAPGNYYLITSSYSSDFIDTSYPNIPCPNGLGSGCQLSQLNTISLNENEILSNIDIQLVNKPVISGYVTQSSIPNEAIYSAKISLYSDSAQYIKQVYTDSNGYYSLTTPDAGDYYVIANKSGFYESIYDGIECSDVCDFDLASLINVGTLEQIENINFQLNSYFEISGTIKDSETLIPLTDNHNNFNVHIYNDENQLEYNSYFDPSENWSFPKVRPGNYQISSSYYGYLATKYNTIPCIDRYIYSCISIQGNIITHGNSDIEIDLLQIKGASIKGRVLDYNNQPVSGAKVKFYSSENSNDYIHSVYADNQGYYQSESLSNGSYYVLASGSNVQDEVYPNNICSPYDCDVTIGNLVLISNLQDRNNINFSLNKLGSISGKVINDNNQPISGLRVYAMPLEIDYGYNNYTITDSQGNYHIEHLQKNTYRVYTEDYSHYPEVYNNIQCQTYNCNEAGLNPIIINQNDRLNINFKLSKRPEVTFKFNSNSENPVDTGFISVYHSNGSFVGHYYIQVGNEGNLPYTNFQLDTGNYYFIYENRYNNSFISKVYGGSNCNNSCLPNTGTLVQINNNQQYQFLINIDENFYLSGKAILTNSTSNDIAIRSYNAANFNELDAASTDYDNNYKLYIQSTSNIKLKAQKPGYFSQIHNGINCIDTQCDLSQGTNVTPQLNTNQIINFELTNSNSLSGKILDSNQNPLENIRVELKRNNYYTNYSVTTAANGEYTFYGISPGEYYLRTIDVNSRIFATTYYGNVVCIDNCSEPEVQLITIGENQALTDYDITATKLGSITGENILDTNNQYTPSEIYIYKVNSNQSLTNVTSDIDVLEDGTISPVYLHEGEYKIIAQSNNYLSPISIYPSQVCQFQDYIQCALLSDSIIVNYEHNTHFDGFLVHKLGKISGSITDRESGLPIAARIQFYNGDNDLEYEYDTSSSYDGEYIKYLPNGEYYIYVTQLNNYQSFNYYDSLYSNLDCQLGINCILSQGQKVTVSHNSQNILNISLKPKSKLKINVRNKMNNEKISSYVRVFNSYLNLIYDGTSSSSLDNSHLIEYLNPGEYYIIATSSSLGNYQNIAYPNNVCHSLDLNSCEDTVTSFTVTDQSSIHEVNIYSYNLKGINGFVIDENTNLPLSNIIIDLWNTNYHYDSIETSINGGFSFDGLNTNTNYFISTDTNNGYFDEVYNNRMCTGPAILGFCDPALLGEAINIPYNNTTPVILEIRLTDDENIFNNGFELN